jgi:hypothetical protein
MCPDELRPSSDSSRTRRRFLAGGAALAASIPTVTAGCLSSLPPLGDGQRYGRLRVPPADEPTYRRWLPAPASVDQPVEPYHFVALQSPAMRPGAPELFVARQARVKASLDFFGIGFENYDSLVNSNFGAVVRAAFEETSVRETIRNSGYERTGEYRDYVVFARDDIPRRVAVGDGVVVWTSAYHHDTPNLEALVAAGAGERPRYHEQRAAFDRLTTAAGGNPYLGVNAASRDPTGRPAMVADAIRFGDDAAYQVVHYAYLSDRVPTRRALERALETDDYRFADGASAFDVQLDGRLATVETQVPLHPGRELAPEYELPQVTWGVTHDRDAGEIRFRHEAGEPVPGERLFYDVDRPAAPGKIDRRPLWRSVRTVDPGAEATVDLAEHPDATALNLVYSTGGVSFHVLLGVDLRGETDG